MTTSPQARSPATEAIPATISEPRALEILRNISSNPPAVTALREQFWCQVPAKDRPKHFLTTEDQSSAYQKCVLADIPAQQ